jgi:hypothetical protein
MVVLPYGSNGAWPGRGSAYALQFTGRLHVSRLGERSVEGIFLVALSVGSAGTKKIAKAVPRGVDE